jgi:thiol-disulfide isomerase/thioredoxin
VNFWTYSCINCLRVLPHVRAWAEKYKDRGLVVIGVHTPEFAFEKDVANVGKASVSLGVGYPVAIDNDFGIWRAFNNQAWPALYFIGADGRLRHHVLGEGGYDQSEQLIQQLLSEANGAPVASDIVAISGKGPQAAADERDLRSAETYVGYRQARNFASPGGIKEDAPNLYRAGSVLSLNRRPGMGEPAGRAPVPACPANRGSRRPDVRDRVLRCRCPRLRVHVRIEPAAHCIQEDHRRLTVTGQSREIPRWVRSKCPKASTTIAAAFSAPPP